MVIGTTQLIFFDIENWQISQTVRVSDGKYFRFLKLEFLSDGTLMASSSGPYAIYHMDSAGHVLSTWNGMGFAVSADDKTIAFGENEGTVLVDIASNETMITLNGNYALDSSFSPDNSKIAIDVVGVETATTDIWDLTSQTRLTTLNQTGNARYSPNGKFLAVTAYDEDTNPLKIFSPDGATLITTLKVNDPNQLNGSAPVFSPDGLIIAAQIAIGSPIAWDTTNWQILENPVLQGNLDSISADGRILITRASDGGILIWGVLP